MEQTLKQTRGRIFTTSTMVKISILGVLSYIIMFFEFPLPFFPPFLKMDFSDLPAVIGGFALGPIAGVMVELIKNLLHFATKTSTGGVGELANFVVGGTFVLTSSYIYKRSHTKKGAIIGLIFGTVLMALAGSIMNAVILLPFYVQFMGGVEPLIQMGQAVNSHITNLWNFAFYIMGPFNIIKGIVLGAVTMVVYKKVSPIIKGR